MGDIIARLQGAAVGAAITERDASGALFSDAAAEIAALRAEVERLRGALECARREVDSAGTQLAYSDSYAEDENRSAVLPSVWQIQNGHLRDRLATARRALAGGGA